jgi:ABC-type nitrate/sulfonate/bicarbonate transport system permease component
MHLRRSAIYRHRRHLVVTFAVVALPFLFLLIFSRVAHLATGALFHDVLISSFRLLVAYLIAAVLAWIAAVSCTRGRRATVALPAFDVLQSFPTFAVLPLATLVWGPSNTTITVFLILTIIWPILFSIVSSLRLANRDWQDAATIAGLRGWPYFRSFLLPVTIPGFITGSIIGIGEGWEALIATEIIVGAQTGLGNFFQAYTQNPTITAFGILGFLLLVFSMNKLIWIPLLEWSHREMET